MRRIVFLTVAGVASAGSSAWGFFAWGWAGSASKSLSTTLFCLFPALSIVAFAAYLRLRTTGLVGSWLLLTGGFCTAYLVNLESCLRGRCTTNNPILIAGGTFIGAPHLWFMTIAALSLLMDFTRPARVAAPAMLPEGGDQDLRA